MLTEDTVCYRHQKKKAAVSCQRCENPVCVSCMSQASVGFHCPDCSRSGAQKVYSGSAVFSAKKSILLIGLIGFMVALFLAKEMEIEIAGFEFAQSNQEFALHGPSIFRNGDWWRIITSGFVHADLMHIGFNGYALWIFGEALEKSVGKFRFLLLFIGGLLGGSLAVLLFSFGQPTVGASGAVMGLAGALSVLLWLKGINVFSTSLGFILGLNLVLPLLGTGISFWGHAGGLAGGALVAIILLWLPNIVSFKALSSKKFTFFSETLDMWFLIALFFCVILFLLAYISGTTALFFSTGI